MKEIILTLMMIFSTAKGLNSDLFLVQDYCQEFYANYQIEYVQCYDDVILNRANKGIVYVEIVKSESIGNYGVLENGSIIAYNKEIPIGQKVTSYCIYNPQNNYCDDVVAVVDNQMIR